MNQKTILITGATRKDGIGYAVARSLVSRGHSVILAARNLEAARSVAAELGENAQALLLDLESQESISTVTARVSALTTSLDVLINNAGVLLDMQGDITTISDDTLRQTFQVNVFAPVLLTQQLLPLLQKSPQARIINVSSGAGQLSDGELANWAPAYSASKAALNACTQQLAAALLTFSVNSVCPGWCRTHMGGDAAPRTPEEGADTIVWLALETPNNLTGQFLRDRSPIPW